MGLFRRGTKLLRLGSGLRDCCCRPEKPEECWCPDTCSYYVTVDGQSSLDVSGCDADARSIFLEPDSCANLQGSQDDPCTDYNGVTKNPSSRRTRYYLGIAPGRNSIPTWPLLQLAIGATRRIDRTGFVYDNLVPPTLRREFKQVSFYSEITAGVRCGLSSEGIPRWGLWVEFSAGVYQQVQEATPAPLPAVGSRLTTITTVFIKNIGSRFGIDQESAETIGGDAYEECKLDQQRSCGQFLPSVAHLKTLTISVSQNGATISGDGFNQSYEWTSEIDQTVCTIADQSVSGAPISVPCENPEPLAFPGDESLMEMEIQIQKRDSCQPSLPCDCTQSLNGMIVTFEGQEFNYGALDSFFNAGTWWEETSAGVFRRRDTEPCDGSLNQTVKQATIECTQINGVDTWVCYLDHTCEERDAMTCPAPPDAGRNKQWTGVFECDENGKPTGSPGSLEVDYDTTSGTPAVECVDALTVPSISISAPP